MLENNNKRNSQKKYFCVLKTRLLLFYAVHSLGIKTKESSNDNYDLKNPLEDAIRVSAASEYQSY